MFYKRPDQYSSNVDDSRSSKTRQVWESVIAKRNLRRHDD
jgi:hypothetical protein